MERPECVRVCAPVLLPCLGCLCGYMRACVCVLCHEGLQLYDADARYADSKHIFVVWADCNLSTAHTVQPIALKHRKTIEACFICKGALNTKAL